MEKLVESVAKVFEEEVPPAPLPQAEQAYKDMTRDTVVGNRETIIGAWKGRVRQTLIELILEDNFLNI